MKRIGIFQAKTHFSELCQEVYEKQAPYLIEKRGKALALLVPVPVNLEADQPDILAALEEWKKTHGKERENTDFPGVWKQRGHPKGVPVLG